MTSNNTIRQIGRALYGDNWMRPLARALGIDERQVRRWANDETIARRSSVTAVLKLAENQRELLASLIHKSE